MLPFSALAFLLSLGIWRVDLAEHRSIMQWLFMLSFTNFQLPLLCGLPFLEKSASQTAHWVAGRSGKHLFLTDNDDGKPPLLLQMVKDSDDLHFMLVFDVFSGT